MTVTPPSPSGFGTYLLSLPIPAALVRTNHLSITVHFPGPVSSESIQAGDLTAEEFRTLFFPSAITLQTESIPPHQARIVEIAVSAAVLEGAGQPLSAILPPDHEIERLTGIQGRLDTDLALSASVFASSIFIFCLIFLRDRRFASGCSPAASGVHGYIVFPQISMPLRRLFSLCLILLFAIFTLSCAAQEALLLFTLAVIMQLRRAASLKSLPALAADIRSFTTVASATVFAVAAAAAIFFASKSSLLAAENLGFAYSVSSIYIFFSSGSLPWKCPETVI